MNRCLKRLHERYGDVVRVGKYHRRPVLLSHDIRQPYRAKRALNPRFFAHTRRARARRPTKGSTCVYGLLNSIAKLKTIVITYQAAIVSGQQR
jgi:hypothetical protein